MNAKPNEPREEQAVSPRKGRYWPLVAVHTVLATAVLFVYLPVAGHRFLTYDDSLYVTANPNVQSPITIEKLAWAFTSFHAANWHPLTWLSHMIDCALFGVTPGAHHMVNVAFHVANCALLFELLRRISGHWKRSAVVAALFALHPMHVESVAWIAERKDVLCSLFFLLTLLAYHAYTKKPLTARYVPVVAFFALSLMAKPMAVTLPFVLLLLDYWPLERFSDINVRTRRLFLEKAPLLALSALSCAITLAAQRHAGAIQSVDAFPWTIRLANMCDAYVQYLFKVIWPAHLSAFYPHPGAMTGVPWIRVGTALVILALVSACAWIFRHKRPYLLTGWCWFLGMLVPAIGIVQVGAQGMADRYTYLPFIGVFIAGVWTAADMGQRIALPGIVAAALAVAVTTACGFTASHQLDYWKDSVTLFAHALETTGPHEFVRCALGKALLEQNRLTEAAEELQAALQLDDGDAAAHTALGIVYLKQKRLADATSQLRQALQLEPNDADTLISLGNVLNRLEQPIEAAQHYRDALRVMPNSADAHAGLGSALLNQGDAPAARAELETALRLDPRLPSAHVNYGILLLRIGAHDEAIRYLTEAIRLDPKNEFAHINMGMALAAQGEYTKALPHFREAVQLAPENPEAHNNLGVALLNLRQPAEAMTEFSETIARNPSHVNARLNIATICIADGRSETAIKYLEEAARISPEDPRVRDLMKSARGTAPQ